MKLTYPFSLDGKVSGIYFPTGKKATCEFASKNCLIHCFAISRSKDKNKIAVEELKKVYQFFKENKSTIIAGYILKELNDNKIKMLHWFVSGDCTESDEDRIISVIEILADENIIQCGFTRNKSFWDKANNLKRFHKEFLHFLKHKPLITFALTVEEKSKAIDISLDGLVSFPNFKNGTFDLYKNRRITTGCSTRDRIEKINTDANCLKCYFNAIGCFTPDR